MHFKVYYDDETAQRADGGTQGHGGEVSRHPALTDAFCAQPRR